MGWNAANHDFVPYILPALSFKIENKYVFIVHSNDSICCVPLLGVQKERMVAEDMYVMAADGKVLSAPSAKPWPNKPPKCTDCAPLFLKVCECSLVFNCRCCFYLFWSKTLVPSYVLKAYLMRGAGAVIHSHGMETCIATMLNPGAKEFRVNPLVQLSFSTLLKLWTSFPWQTLQGLLTFMCWSFRWCHKIQ